MCDQNVPQRPSVRPGPRTISELQKKYANSILNLQGLKEVLRVAFELQWMCLQCNASVSGLEDKCPCCGGNRGML